MIKFSEQVPSIYSSASRDFQYLGWLIDIVLNSVKHNVDDLYTLPNISSDLKITELLAMTLGFKIKRNYDKKQLAALVSILPSILRYKGTEKAIEIAAEALIKAAGAAGDFSCEVHDAQLDIILPVDLVDTTLFTDLLDYILPAGMGYRIIRRNQIKKDLEDILVGYHDEVKYDIVKDLVWSIDNTDIGLSGLFVINDEEITDFGANFKHTDDTRLTVNAGLLNNTVIPVITSRTSSDVSADLYVNMITYDGKILFSSDGKLLLGKEV
jgi:hypothetical protein